MCTHRDWRIGIGVKDKKNDKRFIPYQTYSNMRILLFGAEGFTRDWAARKAAEGRSDRYLLVRR